MTNVGYMGYRDTLGVAHGYINNSGAPQICSQSYLQALGEGDISGHTTWTKVGYTPTMTTTESDLWSRAGVYVFPVAAQQMEVISSDETPTDVGTSIFSGTATGGTTISLIDTGKNFNAGTPVVAGDCIVLDKSGTTPEWGYVSAVTGNTELAVAGGFSSGGTGNARAYTIVDKSGYTGAQAVRIEYLDGAYATKSEIVLLNGNTAVATVNTNLFRINSFRVIATGTGNKPVGNLSCRATADTPVYSYITAGFTRARSSYYTVPAGKTLYVVSIMFGYGYAASQTHYARLYTRANIDASTGLRTGSIFYPFTEVVCANSSQQVVLDIPTKLPAKTDIKVSGIASGSGIASVALRGWLE